MPLVMLRRIVTSLPFGLFSSWARRTTQAHMAIAPLSDIAAATHTAPSTERHRGTEGHASAYPRTTTRRAARCRRSPEAISNAAATEQPTASRQGAGNGDLGNGT